MREEGRERVSMRGGGRSEGEADSLKNRESDVELAPGTPGS